MKKLICIFLAVLLLCGCSAKDIEATSVTENRTISSFYLEYDGNREAGVSIDKENKGLHAFVVYSDGTREEVYEYELDAEVKLVPGNSSIIHAIYGRDQKMTADLDIECSTPLTAVDLEVISDHYFCVGDEVNDASLISVSVVYNDGSRKETDDWNVEKPVVLQQNMENEVVIKCEGLSKTISIRPLVLKSIEIGYLGKRAEGTVISSPDSFVVKAVYDDGSSRMISDFKVLNQVTLEAEKESSITIEYLGIKKEIAIMCSSKKVVDYSVTYDGPTVKGTVIDYNSQIGLHLRYSDGTEEKVYGWTIEEPITLEADRKSTVTIIYHGKKYRFEVQCTTLSEEGYKKACKNIPYKNLARTPDKYKGELIHIKGEVMQVIEGDDNMVHFMVLTKKQYGVYVDDIVYVEFTYQPGTPRILEKDSVEIYGEYYGLYTYTTVMGASKTVPAVIGSLISYR